MAEYTDNFSLKFKEGTVLDLPSYTIAVPDGFEARTSVDGRDFVIRKRFAPDIEADLNGEDPLCGEIVLSHTPQESNLLIEGDCTSKQTTDTLATLLFPGGGRGGSLKRFKTDLSVGFIEQMMDSFYITIILNQRVFRMWLLVQDPAFQRDPTGEYPEFSEKNIKDIEKMIKKWVSTIQSKEDEDEAESAVNEARIQELEASLGPAIAEALLKEAAAGKEKLLEFSEVLKGMNVSRMRGVNSLSERLKEIIRQDEAFCTIVIERNSERAWISIAYASRAVTANHFIYPRCGVCASGGTTKEIVEMLIKRIAKVPVRELYLDLLGSIDWERSQGFAIRIKGVRKAIFPAKTM